jgi:hypothetical protein
MATSEKYPKTVDQLPSGEFYAILTAVSIHVPGDERSRQAPGHGYPEHTDQHWDIRVFATIDEWRAEILLLDSRTGYMRQPFKAAVMKPAVIERVTRVWSPT